MSVVHCETRILSIQNGKLEKKFKKFYLEGNCLVAGSLMDMGINVELHDIRGNIMF